MSSSPDSATFMSPPFLRSFIQRYRELPCLWNPQHPLYTSKSKREAAMQELLTMTRHAIPHADLEFLRKKIDSVRGSFRKEHHRVLDSQGGGAPQHVPRLWYYPLLMFTAQHNDRELRPTRKRRERVFVDCQGVKCEEENSEDSEVATQYSGTEKNTAPDSRSQVCNSVRFQTPRRIKKKEVPEHKAPVLSTDPLLLPVEDEIIPSPPENHWDSSCIPATKRPRVEEDEHDLMGKMVAAKLRRMDTTQRIHADKLISDVLYKGLLNQLTTETQLREERLS